MYLDGHPANNICIVIYFMNHLFIVLCFKPSFHIAVQKISPAGKSKVQLQVLLYDGVCSTFHFANPGGPEAQAKERDQVKMLRQDLLPKF